MAKIRIPAYGTNGQLMTYLDTTTNETLTRKAFFEIMAAFGSPDDRVYLDLEDAKAYILPEGENHAKLAQDSYAEDHRMAEKERARAHCASVRTKRCDGWKKDENGRCRCEICPYYDKERAVSYDTPVGEDDGTLADYLPADSCSLEDEYCLREDQRHLHELLAALSEEDRSFILAAYEKGSSFKELAERFALSSASYASKRAGRIVDRLRKKF